MQELYTPEELDTKINPPRKGWGNSDSRPLTEEQQQDIAHFCKTHTLTTAQARFGVKKGRIKLICDKYGVEPAKRYAKVHKLGEGNLKRIQQMVGREYCYMTFERLVTGYTLHEESVTIHTKTLQYGQSKDVKLGFEGIGKELDYFIKWNTVR